MISVPRYVHWLYTLNPKYTLCVLVDHLGYKTFIHMTSEVHKVAVGSCRGTELYNDFPILINTQELKYIS